MRFGLILLIQIGIFSVIGTVIPQGNSPAWYAENYPSAHGLIMALRLNSIFSSWYFIVILVLLCVNLIFCSLLRICSVTKAAGDESVRTALLPIIVRLSPEGVQALEDHLEAIHCRAEQMAACTVYSKNRFGRYGSFITHLSILLVILTGAAALYHPQVKDYTCYPGSSVVLEDGTRIEVFDFHIEDLSGRLDYSSNIRITLSDGRSSEQRDIKVNYPLAFGRYKVYQQTYGTAGSVTVTNLDNGGSDDMILDEKPFLSLDGVSGLWYLALYPDYLEDPSGNITLVSSVTGHYTNPVYEVISVSDGVYAPVLAFPGEELQINSLVFRFNEPVEYPGLRVKETPPFINAMLIFSFVLMTAGLYMTFFCEPVFIKVSPEGYTAAGPRPERMRMDLSDRFGGFEIDEKEESQ